MSLKIPSFNLPQFSEPPSLLLQGKSNLWATTLDRLDSWCPQLWGFEFINSCLLLSLLPHHWFYLCCRCLCFVDPSAGSWWLPGAEAMAGAGVYMQEANMQTLSVSGIAHIGRAARSNRFNSNTFGVGIELVPRNESFGH